MDTLYNQTLEWVAAHPEWANLILFLAALIESLAILGVLLPGVAIMLVAGALIGAGAMDLRLAWGVATLGAIIGDGLSYGLGRHLKGRARALWPFSRHPETLERGERFVARYGVKSVVLGRFVGPIRAVVPLVVGMMGMDARRFFIANGLSAIVWAPAYLLPGIVFGASLTLAAEAASRLVILALLMVGVLWLAAWMTHRLFSLLSPQAGAWIGALLRWADLHPNMGKIAHALTDPDHPDARTLTNLAGLLILATLLLGLTISFIAIGPEQLVFNQASRDLGQSLQTPAADAVMAGLSRFGDPLVLAALVTTVFLYLRRRGNKRHASYWLAAAGFAVVATLALGWLLQVPRPDLGLTGLTPWSFPAIHVLGATVVYGFLAVALARAVPPAWRWLPYVAAALLIVTVALARLYFSAEWLSDLIGSAALGSAWVALLGLAFRRHSRFDLRWPGLVLVSLATLSMAFGIRTLTSHDADLERYRPAPDARQLTTSSWRETAWRMLPSKRIDLQQQHGQPLYLQYAGSLQQLANGMATQSWQPATTLAWDNALQLLSPRLPLSELPVIPQVHDGHHEALAMVKDRPNTDTRLVLRLWPTRYRLDGGQPLWVGNATVQHKAIFVGLMALPMTTEDIQPACKTLAADLDALLKVRPPPIDPAQLLVRPCQANGRPTQSRHLRGAGP